MDALGVHDGRGFLGCGALCRMVGVMTETAAALTWTHDPGGGRRYLARTGPHQWSIERVAPRHDDDSGRWLVSYNFPGVTDDDKALRPMREYLGIPAEPYHDTFTDAKRMVTDWYGRAL